MTTRRRIVVTFGPEMLEQIETMATYQKLDVPTFCRNAVRSQLGHWGQVSLNNICH